MISTNGRKNVRRTHEITPDEIFLDSSNLLDRNERQFEARVVRPVAPRAIAGIGIVFAMILVLFSGRAFNFEVIRGAANADISRTNRLDRSVIFATCGGRDEVLDTSQSSFEKFAKRRFTGLPGLSHILGFIRYPKADASGVWWREEYAGVSGVELAFNDALGGINGSSMTETDARGKIQQQNIILHPENGRDITLSIDAQLQSKLYTLL